MANEETSGKSIGELEDRFWKFAQDIRIASLVTKRGSVTASRPMSAHCERETSKLYFLTSAGSKKVEEIAKDSAVTVSFSDTGSNKYLVVQGEGAISNDRAKIKELWSPFAKAWWESADDPDIRLITVSPNSAEIWDGPNWLVAGALMLAAAATGSKPAVGEHSKIGI